MQLICPKCNYRKTIAAPSLPAGATRATCPKCKTSFALPSVAEPPIEPTASPETNVAADTPEPPATLPTPAAVGLPKAGFWIRVVATLLDVMIVFVLQFVLGLLLAMAGLAAGTGEQMSGLVMLLGYVISFAYYIVFTGHCGQTPGKMAVRVKVIRTDGTEIGYGRATFREVVAKFISGIILGIGYLMVAFDEQKQGLHDRMADTYVIKL